MAKLEISCIIVILCSYGAAFSLGYLMHPYFESIDYVQESTRGISCKSDSMGVFMGCSDHVELEDVDNLDIGQIYVFNSPYNDSELVVHRLVQDCSDGCFGYIFKGDNNRYADPVINRSDILYRVKSLKFG